MSIYKSIMTGLDEAIQFEKGGINATKHKINVAPVKKFTSHEIKSLRNSLDMTQVLFATVMGVSAKTVEAWENGRNVPVGTACRMLSLLQSDPNLLTKYNIVIK